MSERGNKVGDEVLVRAKILSKDPGVMTKEVVDGAPTARHGKFEQPLVQVQLLGVSPLTAAAVPERLLIANLTEELEKQQAAEQAADAARRAANVANLGKAPTVAAMPAVKLDEEDA